ncbi:MAG: hypothetical protein ABUL63_02270, partial [Acidobacteriota bacterium]
MGRAHACNRRGAEDPAGDRGRHSQTGIRDGAAALVQNLTDAGPSPAEHEAQAGGRRVFRDRHRQEGRREAREIGGDEIARAGPETGGAEDAVLPGQRGVRLRLGLDVIQGRDSQLYTRERPVPLVDDRAEEDPGGNQGEPCRRPGRSALKGKMAGSVARRCGNEAGFDRACGSLKAEDAIGVRPQPASRIARRPGERIGKRSEGVAVDDPAG